MLEQEDMIRLDGQEFIRVPVHARLRATSIDELPDFVKPVAEQATAASKTKFYWQDAENPDLVWTSFILDTEGVNKNWDYMPRSQLIASHHTAKYKPMDMEHIVKEEKSLVLSDKKNPPAKNTIFGVMTNSAIADADGKILTPKQVAALDKEDELERDPAQRVTVVAWAALYYFLFPQTVVDLVKTIERGTMKVSMERWLKKWDFLVADLNGKYESITKEKAEETGVANRWMTRQMINSYPVIRRTKTYTYGGVASTINPANELSRFIGQSKQGQTKAAAAMENDPVVKNLWSRHDEVVERFAITQDEAERAQLSDEHERLHKAVAAYLG